MLEHHPNRALAHLRRKLRRIPGLVHCSILSKERASGKPGAVHQAKKGSVYFRIVISPDPKAEDTSKDLYLSQITEQTILTLEERLRIQVPFVAAEHDDHAGHRHVHLLALAKARIERQDLKALRESATAAALIQRQERDRAREAKILAVEEAQWA